MGNSSGKKKKSRFTFGCQVSHDLTEFGQVTLVALVETYQDLPHEALHLPSLHIYDLAFSTSVIVVIMCTSSSSFIGLPIIWIPLGAPSMASASSAELVRGGHFSFELRLSLTRRLISDSHPQKSFIKLFVRIEIWN